MNARVFFAAGAVSLGLLTAGLQADAIVVDPIEVGTGLFSSFVQIDFEQGDTFVFEVFYNETTTTSFDLLLILDSDAELGFQLEFTTSGFRPFVNGFGFDGIFESDASSDSFWLCWTKPSDEETWALAQDGAANTVATPGSWDGWVFGNEFPGLAPKNVIIPAPAATAVLGGLFIGCGRRRRKA
ncbi:MAG: hypothetical protein EA377_13365 [Phycisphaerales bacterium]|nr:MAG: hypothetical protein EA377_13365 [Phycisphaerales bacterium]